MLFEFESNLTLCDTIYKSNNYGLLILLICLWSVAEKSNLLVCRSNKGSEVLRSPSLQRQNISQMVFHKIRKEDLEFVSMLSFTQSP